MSTTDQDDRQTGAEGEASDDTKVPFQPRKDDDTPVGDTDQHSKVSGGASVPAEEGVKPSNAAND